MNRAINISVGSLSPTVNWKDLKKELFSIPDIDCQNTFSKLLWDFEHLIMLYKHQEKMLDVLVKSQFIEMFGNPITSNIFPRIKFKDVIVNIINGMGSPPEFSDGGHSFIRATNISNGHIIEKGMLYISDSVAQKLKKYQVFTGDFIFVRSGAYAGDVCVVPDKYNGQYGAYDINVKIDKTRFNPIYLNELFNSAYLESVIRPLTSRSAQPHLNTKQISDLSIIESPIELQNQFADFVKQVDKSKFHCYGALITTKHIRQQLTIRALRDDNGR